ncbi:MAG: sigma-E processing peptidase SpoIIGA [Clostridia bacterium]|nr:sigma-E processing peptidase SpoIIGA [Clostridia bacterium]
MVTVYWDTLFLLNFIIDFLILLAVVKGEGIKINYLRIVTASLFLAFYSIFMIDKRFEFLYSGLAKFTVSAAGILIAVKPKFFLKTFLWFYITAFVFSGCIQFLYNATEGYAVDNLIIILLAGSTASYFLITYFIKVLTKRYKKEKILMELIIGMEGREVCIKGLIDTGNSLTDPITKYPVIIAEFDTIKNLFSAELADFMKNSSDINCKINKKYIERIRLIPYTSVGTVSVMKGFKPDYVALKENKENRITKVVVAACYNALSQSGEYNALINSDIA